MVDQVMLVGFQGTNARGDIEDELRAHQMGGVLVGASNWPGARQGAQLVGGLRAAGLAGNRVAPLIVAQQEGGAYRAFDDLPPASSEYEIASTGKTDAVERWAQDAASALRAEGFDLDLFPIADLTGPTSPVARPRLRGQPAGGRRVHGRGPARLRRRRRWPAPPPTSRASDPPRRTPTTARRASDSDAQGLGANDLLPFKAAIPQERPGPGDVARLLRRLRPGVPGALSQAVATGLLRDQLHYKGAAITDDLEAGAIRGTEPIPRGRRRGDRRRLRHGAGQRPAGRRRGAPGADERGRGRHDPAAAPRRRRGPRPRAEAPGRPAARAAEP